MRAVSDGSDPHEAISATPVSTRFANQPSINVCAAASFAIA